MRAFLPTTILSLAAALAWLGWSADPAEAGTLDGGQFADNLGCSDQGQCTCQGQCAEPAGVFGRLCNPDDCGPRWIFTAEAIALKRSTTQSQILFGRGSGGELLNSKDMDFPVEIGPRVSAIRLAPCGWDLEVAYFQVDGFSTSATVPNPSFIAIDNRGPLLFITTDAQTRYTSALYSGEVNVRRQWLDWLNLSAGFRMIELDERYRADVPAGGTQLQVVQSVNAFNHLYGFQLGADAEVYNMGGPLLINVLCKAGVYGNSASQNNNIVIAGVSDQSLDARRDRTAFLGEAGLVATYALTKHVAFRASAQAAWLESVALAPEQIGAADFNAGTASVDTDGGVFYYGGGLGIECRF